MVGIVKSQCSTLTPLFEYTHDETSSQVAV